MNKTKSNSYIQWFIGIFISIVLIITSLLNIPSIGFSSTSGNLSVSGITVSASTSSWTLTTGNATCTIKSTSKTSCGSTSYTQATASITLQNNSGGPGLFNCSVAGSNCDSISYTPSEFPCILNANSTVQISFKSATNNTNDSTLTISNITFSSATPITVTFKAVQDVVYTVDGNSITSDTTFTNKTNVETFSVAAPSIEGYLFVGWYNELDGSYLSSSLSTNLTCLDGSIIYPKYADANGTTYQTGDYIFDDLSIAAAFAKTGTKKVTLLKNATLTGSHTIPSGVTFVIPFNSDATTYTNAPARTDSFTSPSAFRTLTMDTNASLSVFGVLSVPAQVYRSDTRPSGPYGAIKMEGNSLIDLEAGSNLYCYGYIWGPGGLVHAKNGSTVYECFQLTGWRGGNATKDMNGNSYKVFPMNQYYIQNVEVALRFDAGSNEITFASIYASSTNVTTTVAFIGSNGMFVIGSGYLTKKYNPSIDSLEINIYGETTISYIHITLSALLFSVTMKSEDYVLPIMGGMIITIENGGIVNTGQDLEFHPGCVLNIKQGGVFNVSSGNSLYVYDFDEWTYDSKSFCNTSNAKGTNVHYTPSTRTKRNITNIPDAKMDINGLLEIKLNGGIYTSSGGANIISSEKTGRISFVSGPGSKTKVYEAIQYSNEVQETLYPSSADAPSGYVAISITSAKLKNGQSYINNGGEEFFETTSISAGEDVQYNATYDKWGPDPHISGTITITYKDYFSSKTFNREHQEDEAISMPTDAEARSEGLFNSSFAIKKWIYIGSIVRSYDVGQTNITDLPMVDSEIIFEAYYGGFFEDVYYQFTNSNSMVKIESGLHEVEQSMKQTTTQSVLVCGGDICLFDENGMLVKTDSNGNTERIYDNSSIDGQQYYLSNGIVQRGYGLVAVGQYLYYALYDGTIVRNATFYVLKTNNYYVNNIKVLEGTYYFDNNGRMWYGNTLIDDNHDFGLISSGITQGGGN